MNSHLSKSAITSVSSGCCLSEREEGKSEERAKVRPRREEGGRREEEKDAKCPEETRRANEKRTKSSVASQSDRARKRETRSARLRNEGANDCCCFRSSSFLPRLEGRWRKLSSLSKDRRNSPSSTILSAITTRPTTNYREREGARGKRVSDLSQWKKAWDEERERRKEEKGS